MNRRRGKWPIRPAVLVGFTVIFLVIAVVLYAILSRVMPAVDALSVAMFGSACVLFVWILEAKM